jgi:ABC-2 type transport system ATP-binding protein
MTEAITAAGLRKRYGSVEALTGIDLAVESGTVFALLGPNGAGKSTTVRILTTLTRPDEGEARVAGIDVVAQPDAVRRRIGVVGQKPGFDPAATGRENLILQGALHDLHGGALTTRANDLLDRFGLTDAAGRIARTYSGGMQRKLDLALGLLHRPSVLFLDEPTTGLDPEARAELWIEIGRLAGGEGITVLLTTHYLEEADRLADSLAIVDHGRIVVAGTPTELKSDLHGDTLQIALEGTVENDVRTTLERIDGVSDVRIDGQTVRARARNGAAVVPIALAALAEHGSVASVTVAQPSLDDVYLRYAGRTFEEAEAA